MIKYNLSICFVSAVVIICGLIYLDKDTIKKPLHDDANEYFLILNNLKESATNYNKKQKKDYIRDDSFQLTHITVDESIRKVIYDTTALNLTSNQINSFRTSDLDTAKRQDRERMIMMFKYDNKMRVLFSHNWVIESRCRTKDGYIFENEVIDRNDIISS